MDIGKHFSGVISQGFGDLSLSLCAASESALKKSFNGLPQMSLCGRPSSRIVASLAFTERNEVSIQGW